MGDNPTLEIGKVSSYKGGPLLVGLWKKKKKGEPWASPTKEWEALMGFPHQRVGSPNGP